MHVIVETGLLMPTLHISPNNCIMSVTRSTLGTGWISNITHPWLVNLAVLVPSFTMEPRP
jgi:hypothetical protein